MRAYIDLMESAGLAAVTAEKVIAYARDPMNSDVHDCYTEQSRYAFDSQEDLDRWILSMVGDTKAHVAAFARHELMYRGFREEPKEPLGIHWTIDPEIANTFSAGGPMLEAHVDPTTINWLGSVVRGVFFENDRESELCLIPGSRIRLTDGRTMVV